MENKTLLNETLKSGMESLKTMKPGSEEYAAAVNSLGTLIMGGLFVWNQVNGWFNEEEGHIPLSPTFKDGSRTLMQNIFRK